MTNQLDVSVEVQNSDDLDGLKKYQKIRYICKNVVNQSNGFTLVQEENL